jgi:type I restriction enzyme S subunit
MAEWKPIDELFDFEKGSLQSSKCTPGKYTFVTAAEEWKTHESCTHDCEALIFAMAASGSLGRTHYIKGKFIASDLCFILTPKKGLRLDLTFYYRLFNFLRADIVKKTATGTSKLAINQTNFGAYKLLYFDHDHQLIFRDKIEKINSISESFSLGLAEQLSLLKQLRQAVLQEAIEGKLTADWRKKNPKLINGENHASKLREKIKAEKERLIKEGKIKKEKLLPLITDAEKTFDLPEGWVWCRLGEVAFGFEYGSSAKSKKDGKVPVLRMGNLQNGHIDWVDLVYTSSDTEIEKHLLKYNDLLFNRTNSRELVGKTALYEKDGKIIYAGYIVRFHMCGNINPKYTNFIMNSSFHRCWCNEVKADALGQSNINATKLRDYRYPLAPIAEQQAIVERVDKLMTMISELEKQVTERKDKSERLMQSVLREAFENKT